MVEQLQSGLSDIQNGLYIVIPIILCWFFLIEENNIHSVFVASILNKFLLNQLKINLILSSDWLYTSSMIFREELQQCHQQMKLFFL